MGSAVNRCLNLSDKSIRFFGRSQCTVLFIPILVSLLQAGLVLPAIQQCQVASLKQKKKQELLKEP